MNKIINIACPFEFPLTIREEFEEWLNNEFLQEEEEDK